VETHSIIIIIIIIIMVVVVGIIINIVIISPVPGVAVDAGQQLPHCQVNNTPLTLTVNTLQTTLRHY
jgi:flagellar basal body-associated protein FliL